MGDHVRRFVLNFWASLDLRPGSEDEVRPLVDGIHRLIREAEAETRARCLSAAQRRTSDSDNPIVAAIRELEDQASLPRRPLH